MTLSPHALSCENRALFGRHLFADARALTDMTVLAAFREIFLIGLSRDRLRRRTVGDLPSSTCSTRLHYIPSDKARSLLSFDRDHVSLEILVGCGTRLPHSRSAGQYTVRRRGSAHQLATQIGSGLSGVLYVLDEPSVGLHQRDNNRLIATLKRLRELGNTLRRRT